MTPTTGTETLRPSDLVHLSDQSRDFLRLALSAPGHSHECAVCGRSLVGRRFFADRYATAVCASHRITQCCLCNRIIPGEVHSIAPYGPVCSHCCSTLNYDFAATAMPQVFDAFRRMRIFVPEFNLRLLEPSEMAQAYPEEVQPPLGMSTKTDDGSYTVDILARGSRAVFIRTLAHEMAHLWQWYRGVKAPAAYSEGFCNLVAFKVLSDSDTEGALVHLMDMMEDRDPAYGTAFRELKVVADVYGWNAVVAAMKRFG